MLNWTPSSWQNATIKKQMPIYEDLSLLNSIKHEISTYDGIVKLEEIISLKNKLKNISKNNDFLIIAGSCAEELNNNNQELIETIKTINEVSDIILKKFNKKTIKIGRMAGQYAKPRSNDFEIKNGIKLPIYRGDIINHIEFSKEARNPDPNLMKIAYKKSYNDFNLIRNTEKDFYIAHEALLLDYEESMIRSINNIDFLSSTHFPWIGDRTRDINSAHVEFLSGIFNPIAIKCGSDTNIEDLISVIKKLNLNNEDGKITLTIRSGIKSINNFLPKLITKIKSEKLNVLWVVDPMHGNTKKINNIKIRYLEEILEETNNFIQICKENDINPNGIHIEMSGLNITECIGLSVNEKNINTSYKTLCDPRLNKEQTIYLANNINL